jgi:glycosyltransferase involved in cell wall biosynthesis
MPLWILRRLKFNGRIILAPRGMLNTSAVFRKKWKKKIFLSLFSLSSISKQIVYHATDKQEEADIKKYFGNIPQVYLIQNIPNENGHWVARNKQPGQLNCVFISRIHPIKNLLYAINVIKSMSGCSVVFDIYGTVEDEKYFQECREAMSGANNHIHIRYKGPIANTHVFSVLQNYHVSFLPTHGENFGHVIFEALTSGCVLLISDKTPWQNVQEENAGWALPLTDKNNFAGKLRQVCMMNEEEFNEKSSAAFQYARNFLSSMNLKSRYLSLFQSTE